MLTNNIQAAELRRYNANTRGTSTGDCVKRSMSLAFDLPYGEITKLLNAQMHKVRANAWNVTAVFRPVIESLTKYPKVTITDPITVDQFADEHPNGCYLALVGPKPNNNSNHMVCIRDGQVWDSWDCRFNYVGSFWQTESNKPVRAMDKASLKDYAQKYLGPVVDAEILKYMNKKNWIYSEYSVSLNTKSQQVIAICEITLAKDSLVTKDREYAFKVLIPIEPSWDDEEIIEHIEKIGKTRTYDRMYAIEQQEKKLIDAFSTIRDMGTGSSQEISTDAVRWATKQEIKFIESLPGWVFPLIERVSIDKPGQYSDSYRLRIKKLPGDNIHPDIQDFWLEGYQAWEIKDKLDRYKQDYGIEGIDYYADY